MNEFQFESKRANPNQNMINKGYKYCSCGCWYLDVCEWCRNVAIGKERLNNWIEFEEYKYLRLIQETKAADISERKKLITEFGELYSSYLSAIEKNENLENSKGMNLAVEWEGL